MTDIESILYIDGIVEPAKLASLLGVNVSLIYQDKQKGLYGTKEFTEMTYKEAIQTYRRNLVHSIELKVEKEITEREVKLRKIADETELKRAKFDARHALEIEKEARKEEKTSKRKPLDFSEGLDFEDSMHPLVKKKLEHDIKLVKVREVQAWLKVAIEKREFLHGPELAALLEPFLHVIKNILISIATEFPETEDKIAACMNSLYSFGNRLLEQTEEDENHFMDEMLEKELDDMFLELNFMERPEGVE